MLSSKVLTLFTSSRFHTALIALKELNLKVSSSSERTRAVRLIAIALGTYLHLRLIDCCTVCC